MKIPLSPLSAVLRALTVHAHRPALHAPDTDALTYADLAGATARLVTHLRNLGVQPGAHVLLIGPNTTDALLAFHAVPLAGAVIVPLNPAFPDDALRFLAQHAQPAAALVDTRDLPRVQDTLTALNVPVVPTGPGAPLLERLGGLSPAPLTLPDTLDEDQPISINYTSGTTSDPKGVMLTHRAAFVNQANLLYHLNLRPPSRYLHALPLTHGNGWGAPWTVSAAGATHLLPGDSLRADLLTRGVTHLCASPALLAPLSDPAAPLTLGSPTRVLVAGTSPGPRLLGTLTAQGFEVLHGYGLIETSAILTLTDPADLPPAPPGQPPEALTRQGHPMAFAGEVRAVTEDGQPAPHDGFTPGEIVVRSNQVMRGYHRNRAATRRALEGGWLHTGDLAVTHPDGRLEILDRAGDLLHLGGQPVSSAQVEAALYRHPSVREAVVVAAPHPDAGQIAVAFVTLHPGAQVQGRELQRFCEPLLPAHACPRRVHVVTDLPKTASGKVLRHVLRRRAASPETSAAGLR